MLKFSVQRDFKKNPAAQQLSRKDVTSMQSAPCELVGVLLWAHPPTPNERKKQHQHKSSYICILTSWSLLSRSGANCHMETIPTTGRLHVAKSRMRTRALASLALAQESSADSPKPQQSLNLAVPTYLIPMITSVTLQCTSPPESSKFQEP